MNWGAFVGALVGWLVKTIFGRDEPEKQSINLNTSEEPKSNVEDDFTRMDKYLDK
jgi:hypothetical protein